MANDHKDYSGTPLPKKLGIKAGSRVFLVNAPDGLERALTPLPDGATLLPKLTKPLDVGVLFATEQAELIGWFDRMMAALDTSGRLWVAWPKKASKVPTDMTEDVVREVALPRGLVDNKVCAIDDVWSGLRVVWRVERRG